LEFVVSLKITINLLNGMSKICRFLFYLFPDLSQLVCFFSKSEVQSDKTGLIAPRAGLAKRRAAQAVNLRSSSRTPLKIIDSVSKAKQLELCRADMSFSKTNI